MIIYEVSKKRLVNFEKVCDFAETYLNEHPEIEHKKAIMNAIGDIRHAIRIQRKEYEGVPINGGYNI